MSTAIPLPARLSLWRRFVDSLTALAEAAEQDAPSHLHAHMVVLERRIAALEAARAASDGRI